MPTPNTTEAQALERTAGGNDLESALLSFSRLKYQDLSRNRFAEEREWYEDALFYQRRQWLKWDASNKRWSMVKQDPKKPRPMPVTNHFARTINAVANQLASGVPKVSAIPLDDSDRNRRGAEFAEDACRAIDKESGFRLLTPLLGKHTTLWGMGITWDSYDCSAGTGTVSIPDYELAASLQLGCLNCGNVADMGPMMAAQPGSEAPGQQQAPCPQCGGYETVTWQSQGIQQTTVKQFSKGKIVTEVCPCFEVFIPRDCQNPNLAPVIQRRRRVPLGRLRRRWKRAEDVQADQKQEVHEIYLEALRSLVNYNYMHDQTAESVTATETWVEWDELPKKLQAALEEAVENGQMGLGDGDEPPKTGDGLNYNPDESGAGIAHKSASDQEGETGLSDEAGAGEETSQEDAEETLEPPDPQLDPVEQLHQWGIFLIEAGGKILDWGINPIEGKKPATFWLWEVDPANVYPKGMGVDLVPLQKRLNRIDSLMELGAMSNAAGKWIWPTSQTTKPPSGSPSDVCEYDPIGDGKVKPEFVQPSPFAMHCFQLRGMILNDFQTIGMTNGVQQGLNPQGQTSFRGIAYLGAKAAEQISTQRFLWETAAQLRYEKCLILAKRNWTEERKVKVAGFNGRWGMRTILGDQLDADYLIEIRPDSSRPQSLEEKEQMFQMLLQGGLVDPTDAATREYIIDQANLDNVDLVDHYQYKKAERDLESLIAGNIPPLNPNINIQIFLKVFSTFTLTEEFETLPPDAQQRVQIAIQLGQQQLAQQQAAAQAAAMAAMQPGKGAPPNPAQKLAEAMKNKGQQKGNGLDGVPGATQSPDETSQLALGEGNGMAAHLQ
jgi:hypothetical protein